MSEDWIKVVLQDGSVRTLDAVEGMTFMQILKDQNVPIKPVCEGCGICAGCHVMLEPEHAGKLAPPRLEETETLDKLMYLTDQSRLACQLIYQRDLAGIKVTLGPEE